jgi:hypothetical protein
MASPDAAARPSATATAGQCSMARQMKRLVAIVTLLAGLGVAPGASARVSELVVTTPRPPASCPDDCQAIGQTTGFQVQNAARRSPFRVRRRGRVVAFSITLGRPRQDQIDFFTRLFGGAPQARLTILRPEGRNRHRVTGASEVFALAPYFGSTPTFALDRPLTMKPGYVAALTVPTWAPAFAVGLANEEAWRSSRDPARCDDVRQPAAQQRRGGVRTYGCLYRTARVLYTVDFVADPRPTTPPRRRRR